MKKVLGAILIAGSIFGSEGTITVVGEEIVVTAERIKTSLKDSPSTIRIITREEIEASGAKTLVEALKAFTSINVAQRGGIGKSSSIFMRGADLKHTIVLIDGVKINDPSQMGREPNISHIMLDDVLQIEIIYGPSGVNYGSEGMGGLINIVTQKKKGTSLTMEGGSLRTIKVSVENGGRIGKLGYNVISSYLETSGISAAKIGKEKDGYNNLLTGLSLGYAFSPSLKIETNIRNTKGESEYDGYLWSVGMVDDLDNKEFFRNTIFSSKVDYSPFNGWRNCVKASLCETKRKNDEGGGLPTNNYLGRTKEIGWQNNVIIKDMEFSAGIEYEEEACKTDDIDKKRENKAAYLKNRINLKPLSLTFGGRIDNTLFGSKDTYQVASLISLEDVILRLSWAEGFKTPSLFQLYSPPNPAWRFLGGNSNLKPEESKSLELGIELKGKDYSFKAAHFKNDFENLITYYTDPTTFQSTYKNIGSATTEGDEFGISIKPKKDLSILANYTLLTKANDNSTGKRLLLRPEKRLSLSLIWKILQNLSISSDIVYVGERMDYGNILLPKYRLFNLGYLWKISENFAFKGRIENIFNESYEEVAGYGAPGRSFYGGVKFNL
ncbi:MAG: TonB-dependent receptor [bacterium]